MNRFAATGHFWRSHYLCVACGEVMVSRRGAICWRCHVWEEEQERQRAGSILFWAAVVGGIIWTTFWAVIRWLIR